MLKDTIRKYYNDNPYVSHTVTWNEGEEQLTIECRTDIGDDFIVLNIETTKLLQDALNDIFPTRKVS